MRQSISSRARAQRLCKITKKSDIPTYLTQGIIHYFHIPRPQIAQIIQLSQKEKSTQEVQKKSGPQSVEDCGPDGRGGGYLLSRFRSIIGVVRFNFSVRDGKRWSPYAIATLRRFSSKEVSISLRRMSQGAKAWKL